VHKPTVSVVIPTYNSERPLQDCLESVSDGTKHQDCQGEVEIIIVDAGSTDSTLEIARKYTNNIYPNPLKTGEVLLTRVLSCSRKLFEFT